VNTPTLFASESLDCHSPRWLCCVAGQIQKFWRAAKNLTLRFVQWMQGAFAAHPGADLQTKLFGQHELYSCLGQHDADFQIAVGTHARWLVPFLRSYVHSSCRCVSLQVSKFFGSGGTSGRSPRNQKLRRLQMRYEQTTTARCLAHNHLCVFRGCSFIDQNSESPKTNSARQNTWRLRAGAQPRNIPLCGGTKASRGTMSITDGRQDRGTHTACATGPEARRPILQIQRDLARHRSGNDSVEVFV